MTFEEFLSSNGYDAEREYSGNTLLLRGCWNAAVETCAEVAETNDLTCVRSYDLPSEACEKVAHAIRALKVSE